VAGGGPRDILFPTLAYEPGPELLELGEDERARLDAVAVQLGGDRLTAIGTSRAPEYVSSWSLATAAGWVTDSLQITAYGPGWSRSLSLLRSTDGTWSAEADHHGVVDLADPGLDDPGALANAQTVISVAVH
jgi:hypothetical protein